MYEFCRLYGSVYSIIKISAFDPEAYILIRTEPVAYLRLIALDTVEQWMKAPVTCYIMDSPLLMTKLLKIIWMEKMRENYNALEML